MIRSSRGNCRSSQAFPSLNIGSCFPARIPPPLVSPVLAVQCEHDIHPLDDVGERREALSVERAAVIGQVYEHLSRPAILFGERESDRALDVRGLRRVVRERSGPPRGSNLRVAWRCRIGPSAGHHPEEAGVVEVAGANERVKAVRSARSKRPFGLQDDDAFRGFEPNTETVRRPIVGGRTLRERSSNRDSDDGADDAQVPCHPRTLFCYLGSATFGTWYASPGPAGTPGTAP